jgi:hypothetical protein
MHVLAHFRVILISAVLLGATSLAVAASPTAQVLSDYLASHPQLRLATTADCGDCASAIENIRRGSPPNWPPVPGYEPYLVAADLNGDGRPDVAAVLIDTAASTNPFTLIIFNGPFRAGRIAPSFIQRGLDLRGSGLFFGPPRPKPYRLVMGEFESEGAILEPTGRSYRWAK